VSKGTNLFASVSHSPGEATGEEVVVTYHIPNDGIFLSVDKGRSWAPVNSGLPDDIAAQSFVVIGSDLLAGLVHPAEFKGRAEVGLGVYLTRDGGASWAPLNEGLPSAVSVYCLLSDGRDLLAGTSDRGLWRLPLSALR
jgi:hypothetical protein